MSFALNNFKMLEKAIDSERERGQRNMVDAVKYPIQTRRASVVYSGNMRPVICMKQN